MESLSIQHYERLSSYIPVDLTQGTSLLVAFLVVLFFILIRYFLLVGSAYYFFWRKDNLFWLHDRVLPREQIKNEIYWSCISSIVFAFSGVLIAFLWQAEFSKIYLDFDRYSLWYLPTSFILYTLIHEVYFYFTHVWMHHPKLFGKVHKVHHASVKTSPWASFSFHPYETLVHAAFLPVMVLIIPIHPVVLIFYLLFMTLTAISNHLGVELISIQKLRDLFISGEHHARHHKNMRVNYGLYYTFMDKLMGTEYSSTGQSPKEKLRKRTYE